MTGKQFELEVLNNYEYVIAEFDKDNYYLDDENSAKSLECRLNELFEENEQLKKELDKLEVVNEMLSMDFSNSEHELLKENEQLKQFKKGVFNTINMHLRMLPTARDNEFNEDDGDPSLYTGAIYMLETLKKELEE